MVVDLHAHFPMHLDAEMDGIPPGGKARNRTLEAIRNLHRVRRPFREWLDALVLDFASRIGNYKDWSAGPAVTVDTLIQGRVSVALSVLYQPFDEMDLSHFEDAPKPGYFGDLLDQLRRVENAVREKHGAAATVVHSNAELRRALEERKLALVHVVEGGFHLGNEPSTVDENVRTLAQHGVAYITAAHLFWRQVASNTPALPFLPDVWYRRLFAEPDVGLTDLGVALVDAMAREHILVDLTHMTEAAMCDTFDRLPPDVPVIASHAACRFGGLAYNLTDSTVRKIARRGGLLGLILCDHFCNEGHPRTRKLEQSIDAVCRQIDRIRAVTGSHDHTAIGTDLDGFIKPTLSGFESARALGLLEDEIVKRYSPAVAEKICSGNALRLLQQYWR
jgi:microsomal dipeptidase-like Zn-dependent dipeptidase